MSEVDQEVITFLESYRIAFTKLDAQQIAEHFAYPLHIAGDGREVSLTSIVSQPEWLGSIERLLDMYRGVDFHEALILDLAQTPMSRKLAQARVHWGLLDPMSQPIYDFHALYTLVRIGEGLRIVAIAHDEVPMYRAYLARRQSTTQSGA